MVEIGELPRASLQRRRRGFGIERGARRLNGQSRATPPPCFAWSPSPCGGGTPYPLVQSEPDPLSRRAGGDRGAAVEQLRLTQRLKRARERALAFAGGGDVEPGAVVGGVEQRAAQGAALGATAPRVAPPGLR